jgi:hypothetical protein
MTECRRRPKRVVTVSVVDLNVPLPLALAWRNDNTPQARAVCKFSALCIHRGSPSESRVFTLLPGSQSAHEPTRQTSLAVGRRLYSPT